MLDLQKLREIKARVQEVPDKVRVGARVVQATGLLWEMRLPGVRAAVTALAKGATNPTLVYRIHAANSPDKPAVRWRDVTLTFAEVDERIDKLALGLKKRGVGRGTAVVLMMRNRPEFILAQGALTRLGAMAVSVSWRSTASELLYLAQHSGAKVVLFEHDFAPIVEQVRASLPTIAPQNFIAVGGDVSGCPRFEEVLATSRHDAKDERGASDDASVVIYTSGTTGKPKGAVRKFPKDAVMAAVRFIGETPMRTDDVHLVTCPLYHTTALGFSTFALMLGGTAVLMDEFKPEPFLEHVARFGVTTTAVVPTMLHRVLSLGPEVLAKYNTRSLRIIFAGGAPLPGPLATEVMDHFGDILFNFYGATETGVVTLAKPADLRAEPTTIGKAVPGNEIRLLDDKGGVVKAGEVGELYARSKMLVSGYHNDTQATSASMKEGFFSVGDLARQDRDGRFFIEGRKRDMLISGGVNVYPAEVEAVLEAHPDVGEVAVVGIEDREWGERVRAFVAPRVGHALDEGALKVWCKERLSGPKVPRDFIFMETLPRNPTGKVLKRELREWRAG